MFAGALFDSSDLSQRTTREGLFGDHSRRGEDATTSIAMTRRAGRGWDRSLDDARYY